MPTDDLLPLYLDSIGPIPWIKLQGSGNTQDLARHAPPGQNGQIIQPTGGQARILQGELLFFRSLDTDLYPAKFREAKLLAKQLDQTTLYHPEEGQVYGHLSQFDYTYSSDELNGVRVSFKFEEALTRATVLPREVVKDAFSQAEAAAISADEALAILEVALPAGAPPLTASVQALSASTLGESEIEAQQIQGQLNTLLATINTLQLNPELQDADNSELYYALRSISDNATRGVEQALAEAREVMPFVVEAPLSPAQACIETYRTLDFLDLVVELNPPDAPWYWPGRTLSLPLAPRPLPGPGLASLLP